MGRRGSKKGRNQKAKSKGQKSKMGSNDLCFSFCLLIFALCLLISCRSGNYKNINHRARRDRPAPSGIKPFKKQN
jgi:hypothetical protein